jgi:glycosyltransferase involved in cell wall biosynthesis
VDPARIIELSYLPSLAVRSHAAGSGLATADGVRRKYDLPACYVFYPAYYSDHKNHLYLLEGLLDLERRHGIVLHAVFCGGGDPGDQEAVERQVGALGLKARVKFLGLVPDEDIPALYEGALALVMPAHFGPTNLPPLEAATLGCPVIYSDLPAFREQMGDAALYCDLDDVSSLADHLAALIQNQGLRISLQEAGQKVAAEIAQIDYGELLRPILDRYAYVRRRWTWPETIP